MKALSCLLSIFGLVVSVRFASGFVPTISSIRSSRTALSDGFLSDVLGGLFKSEPAGPHLIMEIPASQVKIGALRFLLQIYLVGEQNKPEPKSWFTKQGDELGDLQVYYQDGSGMLAIELQDYGLKFMRHGEKPSLQYRLQESVLLHGVLDELSNLAFETSEIEEDKRLLRLKQTDAIDKAREALPARKSSGDS